MTAPRYLRLSPPEIGPSFLDGFARKQQVTRCLRKSGGAWVARDIAFTDDWSAEERRALSARLQRVAADGGFVFSAWNGDVLAGFIAVAPAAFGSACAYLDLLELHVAETLRGYGIGRRLFSAAVDWARTRGADALYISAHSAVETQAFYRAMGCAEAREYNAAHVAAEPCDCQLEYRL